MEVTPLGEGDTKNANVATLLEKIIYLLMEDPDEHLPLVLKQFDNFRMNTRMVDTAPLIIWLV
jgi:hypothetical protein